MKLKAIASLVAILFLFVNLSKAQTKDYTTWGAWFHTQKFSTHWGASFDGQFRSANHAAYLRNVLLRPSANYYFNKNTNLALGYAYVATNGRTGDIKTFRPENRIFEQFIISHKLSGNQVSHRFRLEQRFLGSTATQNPYFSQRMRYFVRGIIPLQKKDSVFTKGTFVALQNEFFVNVQNKAKVNGHAFDQNRAYAAFGYRLNKMIDVEAGYLNQYLNQAEAFTLNHVLQFALYTRF